jgi:hypothetical protein
MRVPRNDRSVELASLSVPQQSAASGNRLFEQQARSIDANARAVNQFAQNAAEFEANVERVAQRRAVEEANNAEAAIKQAQLDFESDLQAKRRGVNAKGYYEDVAKWWDDVKTKYTENLAPASRRVIGASLQTARLQSLSAARRYEDTESERAADEAGDAAITAEINRVVRTGDGNATGAALEVIQRNVTERAARKGWTTTQMREAFDKNASYLHVRMIESLVENAPAQAEEYYAKHKGQIGEANYTRIERLVKASKTERVAEEIATSVQGLPYDQQLARVAQIKDPDERKAARRYVQEAERDRTEMRANAERRASDQVWQLVAQGVSFGKLPRKLLDELDGKERLQVTQHYEAEMRRRMAEAKGSSVKTDMALYEKLMLLPPEEFVKERITSYADRLSRQDTEQLINRQATFKQREGQQADKQSRNLLTFDSQVSTAQKAAGIKQGSERAGRFRKAAQNALIAFEETNGRGPTDREKQQMLDSLLLKRDTWFFGSQYFFEADEEDKAKFPSADSGSGAKPSLPPINKQVPASQVVIPPKHRKAIEDLLKREGIAITEGEVQRIYREGNAR